MLQRQAIQVLHSDEGFAMLVVNFIGRADVRMIRIAILGWTPGQVNAGSDNDSGY
jgi:hypothetical protein